MDISAGAKKLASHIPEKVRPWAVFLASFALIASVQWFAVWNDARLIDGQLWVPAIGEAMEGKFPAPDSLIYGYPGTSVLFPAAALESWLQMGTSIALRVVMTLLPALAGAFAAMLAYVLRPRILWWAFVAWLYAFQSQFSLATPPSGLLVAFLPLLFLLVLYAAERTPGIRMLAAIGAFGGIMLATRLESSLFALSAMTLYLAGKRFAALYVIPLSAAAVFALLDPTLWTEGPLEHFANIAAKVLYLSGPTEYGTVDPLAAMLAGGMIGTFTLVLATLLLVSKRLRSLPAGYLAACTGTILAFVAGISLVQYHPSWLYAPFLTASQLFLPLLALDAYRQLPEDGMLKSMMPEGMLLRIVALLYLGLSVLAFWADIATVY